MKREMQKPLPTVTPWAGALWPLIMVCLALIPRASWSSMQANTLSDSIRRVDQKLQNMIQLLDSILARASKQVQAESSLTSVGTLTLFDGKVQGNWSKTGFPSGGDISVEPAFRGGPGALIVGYGDPLNGVTWNGPALPKSDYEISLEAMRLDGSDFFLGMTFPVGEAHATLVLGGWGGGVVGISSIDGKDASENETKRLMNFSKDRWYRIRLRVTKSKVQAWIDEEAVVNQDIKGRAISLRRGEISLSVPLGLATYRTSAAYRNITLKRLTNP